MSSSTTATAPPPITTTMKALEFIKTTGEIKVVQIPKPTLSKKTPKPNQLLVQVVSAAIDQGFGKVFPKGKIPDGWFIHSSSSPLYLGWHYSGIVVDKSSNTGDDIFPIGTAVFGFIDYAPDQRQGTFAEYIVVNSNACGIKPESVSFDVAAAAATESVTALQALRDCGKLTTQSNDSDDASGAAAPKSILICGASGGVGSAAMGVAKAMNASHHVTAMCSEREVQRLQQDFHPDAILNRSQYQDGDGDDPILRFGKTYDIIFDCPSAFASYKYFSCLNPQGTFVVTTPSLSLILGFVYSILTWWTGKRVRMVMGTPRRDDLTLIGTWLAEGKLLIPIGATFDVSDLALAIAAQNDKSQRPASGRVVIHVKDGWKQEQQQQEQVEVEQEPKKEK